MCQTPDEPQYRPPIFSREVSKEEVQEALKFIREYKNEGNQVQMETSR
jgi:hypothetical protein